MAINKIVDFKEKKVRVYATELNNDLVSCSAQFVESEKLSGQRVRFEEKIYKTNNLVGALNYYIAHLKECYIK